MSHHNPTSQTQPLGTYTHSELSSLANHANPPTAGHLISAADYIVGLFQANGISYALMGGFSLRLRGSPRETSDVDLTVDCAMQRILEVLTAEASTVQARILRPLGPVSGVMRIFVSTGGVHDPDLAPLRTAVDIIIRGSLGAPETLQQSSESLSSVTSRGQRVYTHLRIPWIIASKFLAFFARGSTNDYEDIVYLCSFFSTDVTTMVQQLSANQRETFMREYKKKNRGQANYPKVLAMQQLLGFEQ